MQSRNLKVLSASALLLFAFSTAQAAQFGAAQEPAKQTVPCKPDNSNCPHKKLGKKGPTDLVTTVQPTAAAGNPCAPGKPAQGCLKWVNGDIKIKPRPKP